MVGSLKALVHSFLPAFYITSSSDLQEQVKYLLDNPGCNDNSDENDDNNENKEINFENEKKKYLIEKI